MKALIIVDVQYDFMPGGALEVPEGDRILPLLNRIQSQYDLVALTQDWHPKNHVSFASNHEGKQPFEQIQLDDIEQTLWPDHCVWGSPGARVHSGLNTDAIVAIFRKGVDPAIDSYSGFFDNDRKRKTGLAEWLKAMDVEQVHVAGLAAEICVAFTATDAQELGFDATVLEDATVAFDPEAWENKSRELQDQGVRILPSDQA